MLKFIFNLRKIFILNLVLITLSQFSFAQEKKVIVLNASPKNFAGKIFEVKILYFIIIYEIAYSLLNG